MHSGDLGDHIGMESCVDLETDTASPLSSGGGGSEIRKRWAVKRSSTPLKNQKELPPPLPIQTSTVMKRYYTDDGRLVITEEKIESPKYHFTAHRSQGRLTLQIVCSKSSCDSDDEWSSCENNEEESAKDEYGGKVAMIGSGSGGDGGSIGAGNCFSYNAAVAAATGSCFFVNQNQLHTMKPVQI